MKKFLTITLSFIMILLISTTAFAQGYQSSSLSQKVTLNEYELAKQLAEESVSTLNAKGYNSVEINNIKNYQDVYRNHIEELNMLNDSALKNNGYSQEQISIIRNFTGTDTEMTRLGATLTLNSVPASFKYTTGGLTTGKLTYNWYWTGIPAFKMQDMVAVSWNNWDVVSNSSYVDYYNVNTGAYHTSQSATYSEDGNGLLGAGHKFRVSMSDNYYYAKLGGGTFNLESDSFTKKNFFYYMEYGHSQIFANISFSVGFGGADASISFTTGTVTADYNKGQYKFPN